MSLKRTTLDSFDKEPSMNTFFDAFSGVGGFRLGLDSVDCVGYSEVDENCISVYERHFNDTENWGDMTKIDWRTKPHFDLFVGGFPCQPFSRSGNMLGFEDTRGTLFFEIIRCLREKRPPMFLLENVGGLKITDGGEVFKRMKNLLGKTVNGQTRLKTVKDCLNYHIYHSTLNSKNFGVPQNRKRIFIVGFDSRVWDKPPSFQFPNGDEREVYLEDVIEKCVDFPEEQEVKEEKRVKLLEGVDSEDLSLTHKHDLILLSEITGETPSGLSRQGDRLYSVKGVSPTLTTFSPSVPKVLYEVEDEIVCRKLSPEEYEKLQGFPTGWTREGLNGDKFNHRDRYEMIGNAVTTTVVRDIVEEMRGVL